eukprot:gene9118-8219_t
MHRVTLVSSSSLPTPEKKVLQPPQVVGAGAGVNPTFIVSCGAPSSARIGFVLGNNAHLGGVTWGMDIGLLHRLPRTCAGDPGFCLTGAGSINGTLTATTCSAHSPFDGLQELLPLSPCL